MNTRRIRLALVATVLASAASAQITEPQHNRVPNRFFNQGTVFFTEGNGTTDLSFGSATLSGRLVRALAENETTTTLGIGFDDTRRHVYVALGSPATIERMNIDGSGRTTVPITPGFPFQPRGVEIDEVNRRIYWISPGVPARIASCAMDGSDPRELVHYNVVSPVVAPRSIHVDGAGGKMYWLEAAIPGFRSANLDGTDIQTELTVSIAPYAVDVDVVNGDFYWAYQQNLYRAPIDGSSPPQLILVDTDLFDFDQLTVNPEMDIIAWIALAGRIRWTSRSNPGVVHESPYIGYNASGSIELVSGPTFVVRFP